MHLTHAIILSEKNEKIYAIGSKIHNLYKFMQSIVLFAWKWLFAETLDNYCKKLAGPGMVFSVQGEGTFREAILLSTVYCTSEGKEPIFYLMDANYHYWAHPYQFGMQRTKNSMRSIFAWYVPSLSLNTWNGQILEMLELG